MSANAPFFRLFYRESSDLFSVATCEAEYQEFLASPAMRHVTGQHTFEEEYRYRKQHGGSGIA